MEQESDHEGNISFNTPTIKKVKVISSNHLLFMNILELGRRGPQLRRFLRTRKEDKVKVLQEP